MRKTQETLRNEDSIKEAILCIAFELSNSKWKLAFSDGSKIRYKTITAGNLAQLQVEIELAKRKFRMIEEVTRSHKTQSQSGKILPPIH